MKTIERIIRDVPQHWVGDGFPVRTLFSYQEGNRFDPFLLLDYAGPHEFAPSEAPRGVGEHPHRGFETVTIVYQGELEHGDSSGSRGSIGPGDVQWMTAGSGVVHEEFHSERFTREGGLFEAVQLWVNLPSKDKQAPPGYQGILDSDIPRVKLNGGSTAKIIAGEFRDVRGPAKTFSPIEVWDLELKKGTGAEIEFSEGHTSLAVIQTGTASLNGTQVEGVALAVFGRDGSEVKIEAASNVRLLILSGEPIGEPVVGHGPFVMNTREEIHQAIEDYQAGRMGRLS